MRAWVPAFVALGANLGDAAQAVRAAIAALEALPEGKLTAASSLYTTAPVDSSGPDYVNAVVRLETGLTAPGLLHALQQIEADPELQAYAMQGTPTLVLIDGAGRIRAQHFGAVADLVLGVEIGQVLAERGDPDAALSRQAARQARQNSAAR